MQKISPLRSSIEAFNKFKSTRLNKQQEKTQENNTVSNPFGIAFKGTVIQMDVFENSTKPQNSTKEKLENTGKLLASAWVGTINKFNSLKTNAIAFGNRIKDNTVAFGKKVQDLANTKVEFDFFKYNVSKLQNRPVNELKDMLALELKGANNEQ